MPRSTRRPILYASVFGFLALFILFSNALQLPYSPNIARGGTEPTSERFATLPPTPRNNGGSAKWTIRSNKFVSNYPKGFSMIIDVTSSGGKISLARIKWRHSTSKLYESQGYPDQSGHILAGWVPNFQDYKPGWVGVEYWWVLIDARGNTYETEHAYAEYADNTRKWNRLEAEDAIIHWEASLPAQIGPAIADALKSQHDRYFQAWGKLLNYKPHIIIYASFKPWQEWDPKVDVNWIEGETDPDWGATVQIYRTKEKDALKRLTAGVVLHELEHLYQQTYNPFGTYHKMVWFYEGDATYLELYQFYSYLAEVKAMAKVNQLPRLEQEPALRLGDRLGYDIGYAFWVFLEKTYGPDAHRLVWEQTGKGLPIQQALQKVTKKPFADLEDEFRVWVGARPLQAKN